jgi:hypothetical protein
MARVTVNLTGAKRKLSPQARRMGQQTMANQAMADMNQFVPADEGILRMTATVDIDGSAVNYNMPYARAQFYGFINGSRIYNYTTPGTSRRWDLRGKARYMADWERAFVKGAGF